MLFGYTYYIFGLHKLGEPNVIATEEKLDSVLMHPFGIDNQNGRLAMPLPYFSGHVDGSGKVDIKPLAIQDALDHDGFHEGFGRAVIQNIRWRGFSKLHIHLNAVALPGSDARHVL